MSFFGPPPNWRLAVLGVAIFGLQAGDAAAIEMFTFYGDGSRIGLPSLEVPIEAYPGIPLRSDRLRARRRALRMGPGARVRIGPPGYARGITIRAMPTGPQPAMISPHGEFPSPAPIPPDPEPLSVEPDDLAKTPPPVRPEAIEEVPASPAE
jgi:hypothetical protein